MKMLAMIVVIGLDWSVCPGVRVVVVLNSACACDVGKLKVWPSIGWKWPL